MSDELIELLQSLPPEQWTPFTPPVSEAEIDAFEQQYQRRFPADHRALLLQHAGSGYLRGPGSSLLLYKLDDLAEHALDEEFEAYIPGMFVFGDNGGGRIYCYDQQDAWGFGHDAVFLVDLGALGRDYSRHLAGNLTELCRQLIEGRCFDDVPPLYEG